MVDDSETPPKGADASPERMSQERPAANRRVLVVDDEPSIVALLSAALLRMGCVVEIADCGEEAWKALQHASFDCVLMDLRMPGMSGEDLFRRLRQTNVPLARHVIFLTGDTSSTASRAFLASTGCLWLSKPFTLDQLERQVRSCLAAD